MYHEAIEPYKNFTTSSQEQKWPFRDHKSGDSGHNQLQLLFRETSDVVFDIEVLLLQEKGSHAGHLNKRRGTEGSE